MGKLADLIPENVGNTLINGFLQKFTQFCYDLILCLFYLIECLTIDGNTVVPPRKMQLFTLNGILCGTCIVFFCLFKFFFPVWLPQNDF